jgi:hypothetical protein
MLFKQIPILVIICALAMPLGAQLTDPQDASTTPSSSYTKVPFKPRLGLGIGPLAFFGEVGANDGGYNAGTADMAYTLSLSNEINSFLDLRLYSTFGTIAVNEYSSDRMLNFSSKIRANGMALSYNFENFFDRPQNVKPYISVGFEAFEFLSKTDLKDANGNTYHYWEDGSIRNMAETDENAANAQVIYRDYVYETDLRSLDLDGLGKYADRSWAVPVGLGAQWNATDRFRIRFGGELHFTLTDQIDNISTASSGDRQGNSRNDLLVYSSVSASYDLNFNPKRKEPAPIEIFDENGEPMLVMIDEDGDKDGVNDFVDLCLGTPEGVKVDANGCPVDKDGDGVGDYMDDEPTTAKGLPVDQYGVTITDEMFREQYLIWTDSLPWEEVNWSEQYARIDSDPRHWSNTYSIQVGSDSDGLTQGEINMILSLNDVKSVKKGDENVYLVGDYKELPDAVNRKIELNEDGIGGTVMTKNGDTLSEVGPEADALETELRSGDYPTAMTPEGTVYRVQIGAYKHDLSYDVFAGIDDLVVIKGNDGLTRYVSGAFPSAKEAAERKVDLLLEGFDGAFITAYDGGGRITLADAGMSVSPDAPDLVVDVENNSIDPEMISFKIQLGSYSDQIPTEVLDAYLKIGNVRPMRVPSGETVYLTGSFDDINEAKEFLSTVLEQGVPEAVVIGDFNGNVIPADEAQRLKRPASEQVSNER